jgi:hypothetical protein
MQSENIKERISEIIYKFYSIFSILHMYYNIIIVQSYYLLLLISYCISFVS